MSPACRMSQQQVGAAALPHFFAVLLHQFRCPRFRQGVLCVFSEHAGLIVKGNGFPSPCDLGVQRHADFRQPPDVDAPLDGDLGAQLFQLSVPDLQKSCRLCLRQPLFQHSISLLQRQLIPPHQPQHRGVQLGTAQVQKRPPPFRTALYEREVFRRKCDAVEHGKQGTAFLGHIVAPDLFFRYGTGNHAQPDRLFPSGILEFRFDLQIAAGKGEIVPFPRTAKAAAAGECPDRLQQVGLTLCIFAQNQIIGRIGNQGNPLEILEAVHGQGSQFHASAVTCTVNLSTDTVSPGRIFLPRMVQTSPLTFTAPCCTSSLANPPVSQSPANFSRESSLMNSV